MTETVCIALSIVRAVALCINVKVTGYKLLFGYIGVSSCLAHATTCQVSAQVFNSGITNQNKTQ